MKRTIMVGGLTKSSQHLIATLQELGRTNQDSDRVLLTCVKGIDEEMASAIVAFIQRRSWKRITLSYCIGPYTHLVISHAMSRSESFHFEGSNFLYHDEGLLHHVGTQLGTSELKQLAIINVHWTTENLTALGMGLSSNTTLEVLELIRNPRYVHEEGIALPLHPLGQGLRHATSLRVLNVKCCWLDDTQLVDLIRGLRDNPSLRELNLFGNECRSQGILQLAALLQSPHSQLQTINLSQQFNEPRPRDPRHPFFNLLLGDTRDESEYTGLDIAPLSALLRTNQTLQRLDLSNNNLTDSDMAAFAHSLRDNTSMQQLSLDGNCFGPEGAKALLELMQSNSAIEWIKIPVHHHGCGFEMLELQAEITFLANWNRAGRRILLQNNVPRSLWSLIVERINMIEWGGKKARKWGRPSMLSTEDRETERASLLFCLLREAPALFERSICE